MQDLVTLVTKEACHELNDALTKIEHCLRQLDDQQICWRPAPSMNSVSNLILHLCGNLRQWITSGIGGVDDIRNRPQEFADHGPVEKEQLLDQLKVVVDRATETLRNASAEDLTEVRTIQGFRVSGMGAIFSSIAHFRGHTQEIVHLTRIQLGDRYDFDFVPSTPQQGAM